MKRCDRLEVVKDNACMALRTILRKDEVKTKVFDRVERFKPFVFLFSYLKSISLNRRWSQYHFPLSTPKIGNRNIEIGSDITVKDYLTSLLFGILSLNNKPTHFTGMCGTQYKIVK